MNLRQIKYFCAVVESGSAVQASTRLFVAPTAISMQLSQLETHLGGALFDRVTRPMKLTELGKYFYPRAKELLTQAERLEQASRSVASGTGGWLGIGFVRSAIFSQIPRAVRRFRETYPEVRIDLVELLSEHQPGQLRSGKIHIGLSRFFGTVEHAADLDYTPLMDEPFVAALPSHHPLAQQTSITVATLCSLPYISYPKDPQSQYGRHILGMIETAGGKPVVAHEAIEIHTAIALVAAGLGATLVARSVADQGRTDVTYLPLSDLRATTSLVTLTKSGEVNTLAHAFRQFLIPVQDVLSDPFSPAIAPTTAP